MTARHYVLNADVKIPALKGQAKIVMDALVELRDQGPLAAVKINETSGPKFKTRQDTLRVTLYYIVIFKGQGLVRAVEPTPAAAPTVEALEETIAAS